MWERGEELGDIGELEDLGNLGELEDLGDLGDLGELGNLGELGDIGELEELGELGNLLGFEYALHILKAKNGIMPVFPQVVTYLAEGNFLTKVRLGVEAVGVADEFLFHSAGTIVLDRYGEVLTYDLVDGDATACMPLSHIGMARQTLFAQQFCTKIAMFDVLMSSCAIYLGGIAEDDTDVMEHGSLFDEPSVHKPLFYPFGVGIHNPKGTVPHLHGVGNQHMTEVGIRSVVLVYE